MTERVSVASDGAQSDGQSDGPGIRGGSSFGPDISGNGRFVTFDSIVTNLCPTTPTPARSRLGAILHRAGSLP